MLFRHFFFSWWISRSLSISLFAITETWVGKTLNRHRFSSVQSAFFFSLKRKRQKRKNKKVSKIRIEWLFYSVFIYAPLLFFFFSPPLSEIHLSVCPFNTCTYLLWIYTAFSPFVTFTIEVLVTWIALVSLTRTRSCTCTVTNYIWLFSKCSNTQMNLSR